MYLCVYVCALNVPLVTLTHRLLDLHRLRARGVDRKAKNIPVGKPCVLLLGALFYGKKIIKKQWVAVCATDIPRHEEEAEADAASS